MFIWSLRRRNGRDGWSLIIFLLMNVKNATVIKTNVKFVIKKFILRAAIFTSEKYFGNCVA